MSGCSRTRRGGAPVMIARHGTLTVPLGEQLARSAGRGRTRRGIDCCCRKCRDGVQFPSPCRNRKSTHPHPPCFQGARCHCPGCSLDVGCSWVTGAAEKLPARHGQCQRGGCPTRCPTTPSSWGLWSRNTLGWRFVDADDTTPPRASRRHLARGEPGPKRRRFMAMARTGLCVDPTLGGGACRPGNLVMACSALKASYRGRLAGADAGRGVRPSTWPAPQLSTRA